MPVRDAAETLGECLASLAAQSLVEHEVVAVDDGSRDESGALLAAAARADRRLRVHRTPPRGLVPALNLALDEARAPLLARMDADDVAHPDRLARQVRRLTEDRATDVLGCRVRLVGARGAANRGMRAYVRWQNALVDHDAIVRDLFVESPLAHPSVAMRAALLRSLGGYRDLYGPEDYDLWLRAREAGARFAKLPDVLLDWRDSPGRLTRRDPRYAAGRFRALKLAALERGPLAGGRPVVVWGGGPVAKGWARDLLERGHRLAAFVDVDPRRIGQRLHGAPVLAVRDAAGLGPAVHLAAVGRPGARERIRRAAAGLGLQDGRDLIAVA